MDPYGSVLVRRGKGVLGSGKLQHHQPPSRVMDMTPVNGRIELRLQKGEGSLGVHFLQAVERSSWGACASSLQGVTHPGRSRLFSSLGSGQRGRRPPFTLAVYCLGPYVRRTPAAGQYSSDLLYFRSLQWRTSTALHRGAINAAAHMAALLLPVRVAERAPRVLAGTPQLTR